MAEELWPPPALKEQVNCVYCHAFLCYPKKATINIKGQITSAISSVDIEFTLVCASCHREFPYIKKQEVTEVQNG